ncbi:putative membrane protein [Youngiibacter multivorans]|uniref:Membrane protein n=2 Tax=Youngiibacter multivorans TaxID=937251 RepID=A0ABS4G289_9CLOT|nr:putative membrane protein [Youngiibacter multivorans]
MIKMRTLKLNGKLIQISSSNHEVRVDKLAFGNLFWLFLGFCLVGYIFETLIAFLEFGSFQSKAGLIYGPFSQIYGIGALLSVLLYRFVRNSTHLAKFLFYSATGSIFEFSAGVLHENILGSYSWDYSSHVLSFGTGRTDILYSLVWGLSAMLIVYKVYPMVCRIYDSVGRRTTSLATLVFCTLLSADMLVKSLAVARYSEKHYGEPPSTSIEAFMDLQFPDDFMERIYPTMLFLER